MALVRETGVTRFYFDGIPANEFKKPLGGRLEVLGNRPGQHGHWSMANMVDDLYIYSRVFSEAEIKELYVRTGGGE